MIVVCLDMEGVLTPEIWISVAERTGIPELRRTTRDEPDYDALMRARLALLDRHRLGIREIQEVIAGMELLPGARGFLDALRAAYPVLILSDTFYPFAAPLLAKLGQPVLFAHDLEIEPASGRIANYKLRMRDQKRETVIRLQELQFRVLAAGDSYNDTSMLCAADAGVLFLPPENVVREFPQFPVALDHAALRRELEAARNRIESAARS